MGKDNPVAVRLSEWVKSTGKKKVEVAQMLGIIPQQLSQVLNGRDGIGKMMQERLQKAGADVDWILQRVLDEYSTSTRRGLADEV